MSSSMADPEREHTMPYKAEYAKSGRSHCKKCSELIQDDDLRICTQVKSRLYDGMQMNWHHSDCFFERYHPSSTGDIENFDDLRNEDKKEIQKLIDSISKREMSPGKHSVLDDFKVEYPKSAKSICPACEETITEDEPRIGKVDFESENSRRFGPVFRYHHVECFTKLRDEFGFTAGGEELPGFKDLQKHDQEYIKKKLPKKAARKNAGGQKRERSPSPSKDEVAYLKEKRTKGATLRRGQNDEDADADDQDYDDDDKKYGQRQGMSRSEAGKKEAEARSRRQQDEDMEEDDDDFQPHQQQQKGKRFGGMTPQEAGRKGGKASGNQQQDNQKNYDEEDEDQKKNRRSQQNRGQRSNQFGGMTPREAGRKGGQSSGSRQQDSRQKYDEEEDDHDNNQKSRQNRGQRNTSNQFGGMTPQEAGREGGLSSGRRRPETDEDDEDQHDQDEPQSRKGGKQFGGMSPQEAGRKGGQSSGRQRGQNQDEDDQDEDDFQPHDRGRHQARRQDRSQFGGMTPQEAGRKGGQTQQRGGRGRKRSADEDDGFDQRNKRRGHELDEYVSDDDYPNPVVSDDEVEEDDVVEGEEPEGEEPQRGRRRQTGRQRRVSDQDEQMEDVKELKGEVAALLEDNRRWEQSGRLSGTRTGRRRSPEAAGPNVPGGLGSSRGQGVSLEQEIENAGFKVRRPGKLISYSDDENFGEEDLLEEEDTSGQKVQQSRSGGSGRQGGSRSAAGRKGGAQSRRGRRGDDQDEEEYTPDELEDEGDEEDVQQGQRSARGSNKGAMSQQGKRGAASRQGKNASDEHEDRYDDEKLQGQLQGRGGRFGGMSPQEAGRKGGQARGRQQLDQDDQEDDKGQSRQGQRGKRSGGMSSQEAGRKGGLARGRQQGGQNQDYDGDEDHKPQQSRGQRGRQQFGGMSPQEAGRKGGQARGRQQRDQDYDEEDHDNNQKMSRSEAGKKGAAARHGRNQDHGNEDEDEDHHDNDQQQPGRRGRSAKTRQPFHGEHSDEIDKRTHEILSNLGKKAAQARLSGHHDDPRYRATSEERKALSIISHLGNRSAIGKKGAAARWGHHGSDEEHDDQEVHEGQQKMNRTEAGRRGGQATQSKRSGQQEEQEDHDEDIMDIDQQEHHDDQSARGGGMSRSEAGKKGAAAKSGKKSRAEDEVAPDSDEYPDEKIVARQNKKYYAIKDAIMYAHNNQEFTKNDMIAFLKFNNGEEPHTGDLYDELADVIAYGALKNCPNCKHGTFVYKSSIGCYECTGDCDYRTDDPPRVPFKVPGDLGNVEFLKKYETDSTERRAIPHHDRPQMENASTLKPYRGPKISKYPLEHFTFFVDPQIRNRQLDQKLRSFGGRIASSVTTKRAKIAVIISTTEILQQDEEDYIRFAKENSIPIVSPKYYDDLTDVDFNIIEAIEKNLICDWMDRDKIEQHLRAVHSDFMPLDEREALEIEKDSEIPLVTSVIDVDPDSRLQEEAHVYKEVGGHYCSEILSKVDVDAGQNKYYKLQVLASKRGHKRYWLFRAWGRYGTTIGNHKCEEMPKEAALSMFKSIFHEKTGNVYGEKRVIRRGHYVALKLQQDEGTREKLVPNTRTSKLPMPVQTLISRIFDIDLMKQTLLDHHVDVKEVPLGQLDQEQMLEAYKILDELLEAVKEEKPSRRKIVELTNYFYTLIPHNFGNEEIPLLDKEELVQRKVLLMENLLEIDIAYDLLVGTGRHHESPIDARYAALDADINVLEEGSELWKQLERYLKNTHAEQHNDFSMEVVNICTIDRGSEETRFSRFIPYNNRKLLWHGTRVSNLASIIYRGLKVAPPIAPATGYMFGKGIYFADSASKAANFLLINKKPVEAVSSGFLLLCDVALGNMATLTKGDSSLTKPPNGKDSVFAAGRFQPDPSDTFKVPSGAVVTCGKLREAKLDDPDPDLNFNEYIIYNEDQVKIEYIVEVNFHLK